MGAILRRFKVVLFFVMLASLAYSSTVNKETQRSSETLVNLYQTEQRHIPDDKALHNYRVLSLINTARSFS
jgi:hypothetical protein